MGGEKALQAEGTALAKAQRMEGAKSSALQEMVGWERMFREMGTSSECWAQGSFWQSLRWGLKQDVE